ncbi:MAG: hypothetical protein RL748_3440, partial [Pseudomonadota bacterium]
MNTDVSLVPVTPMTNQNDSPIITASTMDIADLLVAYLAQLGIEYIFGVPGGAIEPL